MASRWTVERLAVVVVAAVASALLLTMICGWTTYGPHIGHIDLNRNILRANIFRFEGLALVETSSPVAESSWSTVWFKDFPGDARTVSDTYTILEGLPQTGPNPVQGSCSFDLSILTLSPERHYYLMGLTGDGRYINGKNVTELIRIQLDPAALRTHTYFTRLWYLYVLLYFSLPLCIVLGTIRLKAHLEQRRLAAAS